MSSKEVDTSEFMKMIITSVIGLFILAYYIINMCFSSNNNKKEKFEQKENEEKIIMKNMRVMNDPAFKSNKTLKEYINKKLESCKEPEFYTQPKSHSILKFNENANKKMKSNRNNKKSKNYDFDDGDNIIDVDYDKI